MPAPLQSLFAVLLIIFCTSHLAYGSTNITVDNQDSRIVYSLSGWVLQPNPQIGPALNGTVTLTRTVGSWFTFEFQGSAIYLVGDDHFICRSFSAVIDGVIVAESFTGSDTNHQFVPYWGYGELSSGVNHTLNITILPNTTTVTNFIIDALIYTPDNGSDTTTTASNGTSVSSTSPFPSQSTLSTHQVSPLHSTIGPIVGGVVGGCMALVAALLVGMIIHRSKRNREALVSTGKDALPDTIPRPFPSLTSDANRTMYDRPTTSTQSSTPSRTMIPSIVSSAKPPSPATEAPMGDHEGGLSERIVQEMSQIRAELAQIRRTRAHRPTRSRRTEPLPSYDAIHDGP